VSKEAELTAMQAVVHGAMCYLTKAIKTGGIVRLTKEDFELYESVRDYDRIAVGLDPDDPSVVILTFVPEKSQA
jgi:hypothetical protein